MPKTIVLDWVEYELVLEVEQEPLSLDILPDNQKLSESTPEIWQNETK